MRTWMIAGMVGAGLVGVTAASAGQSVSLYFDADRDFAGAGEVVNWTVFASFTGFGDGAYVGGFVGDAFVEQVDQGVANVVGYENLMEGEGVVPTFNGDRLEGVNVFNAALLGTDNQSNPLPIFRVSTEVELVLPLTMTAEGIFSMFPDDGIFTLPLEYTDFEVSSDLVNIPAPGAACVLVGGLVAAGRRRR